LLFLIYASDVKYNILSSITLIADDTALIKEIDNPVNDPNCLSLISIPCAIPDQKLLTYQEK
jgi:hypothetical protein